MLVWIVIAVGLVLVVEGLLYALAPSLVRQMAQMAVGAPPATLRMGGLIAVAAGVAIVAVGRMLG